MALYSTYVRLSMQNFLGFPKKLVVMLQISSIIPTRGERPFTKSKYYPIEPSSSRSRSLPPRSLLQEPSSNA